MGNDNTPLDHLTLGPVTAVERGGTTRLFARGTTGAVPPLAHYAQIVLAANKLSPIGTYNDGYADDLWLVLYDGTPTCTATVAANTSFGSGGKVVTPFPAQQGGKVAALAADVAVQSDGHILLSGYVFEENLGSRVALARYQSNGTLDTSFGEQGRLVHQYVDSCPADSRSYQLTQLPTGDYGLAGRGVPGSLYFAAVMRFLASGSSDSSFGQNADGIQVNQTVVGKDSQHYTVRYQEPNKTWWAAGYTGQGNQETLGLVRRYLDDGTPDSTFNDTGGLWIDRPARDGEAFRKDRTYALLTTTTGGFVVGGNAGSQLMLARYHPNLTPDLSFAGTGFYLASVPPPSTPSNI